MIETGQSHPLGATPDRDGVNFAIYSAHADRVVLCLFDATGNESGQLELPGYSNQVWHGYVPGLKAGQLYGYRVHGRYEPEAGCRFNAAKLLLDPYARQLAGAFTWSPAVYGYDVMHSDDRNRISLQDSAGSVMKGVITESFVRPRTTVQIPWEQTVFYEAHVRGFTMKHPVLGDGDRGTFRGMRNGEVLDYLKALGITSIELMPVQSFIDEAFLDARGMRNYWGYNTLNFFSPEPRYLGNGAPHEFREMVDSIHDAGLEVILDVVYNHTAEGDHLGPTLSLRGIDNQSYYRLTPDDPGRYINDTGCGNTLNFDHAQVRQLAIDSLCYWANDMDVDGFRFDLAPVHGRSGGVFTRDAAFFSEIKKIPLLSSKKLIAEPWDVGHEGYQLGNFPQNWAEWNDDFRDSARRFWRGDRECLPQFARRVHGSSDLFEDGDRKPWASVNFITSHDGFTLDDLVSYENKHNLENGEDNKDGHDHNFSCNYGVEGSTTDEEINALRRRQRLNFLATLLLSQGTPMLLAGDEFGNSQDGNNNAYAQDNDTAWLNWNDLNSDPDFLGKVKILTQIRQRIDLLRQTRYVHGHSGSSAIEWLNADGQPMSHTDWHDTMYVAMLLYREDERPTDESATRAVAIIFNSEPRSLDIQLPQLFDSGKWEIEFHSGARTLPFDGTGVTRIEGKTITCVSWRAENP